MELGWSQEQVASRLVPATTPILIVQLKWQPPLRAV